MYCNSIVACSSISASSWDVLTEVAQNLFEAKYHFNGLQGLIKKPNYALAEGHVFLDKEHIEGTQLRYAKVPHSTGMVLKGLTIYS